MQYLNITQVGAVLKKAWKASTRDHLMMLLAFQHGLRISEVAKLTLADVANGSIHVVRAKRSLTTRHPLRDGKNPVFNEVKALRTWLDERGNINSNVLFPSREGSGVMDTRQLRRIFVSYMRGSVPPELAHPHAFKHACCSILARSGKRIEYIAQYVGHKDIKNTRIYLNITDDEAAADAFAALDSLGA